MSDVHPMAARAFHARAADTMIAIEPVEGMRRVLRQQLPHVRTMEGTAETIPLTDGSTDAVFVGEAFHGFDFPRAFAEIARVLKPGGGLAILYHGIPGTGPEWFTELSDVVMEHRLVDTDRPPPAAWRDALAAAPLFETPVEDQFPYEHPSTRELIVAEIGSFSSVGGLPPDRCEAVLAACREVLERHGVERYTFRYTVTVTTAQAKRAGESLGSAG